MDNQLRFYKRVYLTPSMHRASSLSHLPFLRAPVSRAVLCLVSVAALGVVFCKPVHAQGLSPDEYVITPIEAAVERDAPPLIAPVAGRPQIAGATPTGLNDLDSPIPLKMTRMLADKPPAGDVKKPASFVFGDRISGRPDLETVLDGNAELRKGPSAIRADRIEFYQPDDSLEAIGNVRLSTKGNQYQGPLLKIKLDTYEGYFAEPSYRFIANGGNGTASRIDFVNEKTLIARNATYTTCEKTDPASWGNPAWILTGTSFKFDREAETGEATNATLKFKGIPILAAPVFSFPTGDKRKSGLLPPTFSVDSVSGTTVGLPYYFDIAPNRDATVFATVLTKRGLDLGGEYRYLEKDYKGKLRGDYLPSDKLRGRDRWAIATEHTGIIRTDVPALGNLGVSLNLNRVSDSNYWRDFPRALPTLTQRLLSNTGSLSYGRGYFAAGLTVTKWQTLQDPDSIIAPPTDRLPQITASYTRFNAPIAGLKGFDWSISGDFTRFSADPLLTLQPNANRGVALARISRPWISPGWYITPKMQLHATAYSFKTPLANGSQSATRLVSTFSLDSGLQFERKATILGRDLTQTLEPRAFYVRTPYRDQTLLPNYDSGLNSFNFATVFTENAFVGNDRISDANLLTLGLTSRLLNPETGTELLRAGVAQRLRFSDQQVTLPGQLPVTDRVSDLLFGTTINWTPQWSLDGIVQYNPKIRESERSSFSVRYNPSDYRVVSASLRRQRNISNSVDVGWQWPVNDIWGDRGKNLGPGRGQGGGRLYSVGRLNYSIPDKKLVDGIVGFEYDGCCWISRVVLQRTQTGVALATTRILFQLELIGFSRLGVNPLELLKQNIPRYQLLRDKVEAPSRFTNYD